MINRLNHGHRSHVRPFSSHIYQSLPRSRLSAHIWTYRAQRFGVRIGSGCHDNRVHQISTKWNFVPIPDILLFSSFPLSENNIRLERFTSAQMEGVTYSINAKYLLHSWEVGLNEEWKEFSVNEICKYPNYHWSHLCSQRNRSWITAFRSGPRLFVLKLG